MNTCPGVALALGLEEVADIGVGFFEGIGLAQAQAVLWVEDHMPGLELSELGDLGVDEVACLEIDQVIDARGFRVLLGRDDRAWVVIGRDDGHRVFEYRV